MRWVLVLCSHSLCCCISVCNVVRSISVDFQERILPGKDSAWISPNLYQTTPITMHATTAGMQQPPWPSATQRCWQGLGLIPCPELSHVELCSMLCFLSSVQALSLGIRSALFLLLNGFCMLVVPASAAWKKELR